MDFMKLGEQLLADKLGGGADKSAINSALTDLFGGSSGKVDLGNIINSMQSSGLSSVAASWLGDGQNANISADQIKDMLGSDKIANMASQLNTGEGSLLDSLSAVLPQLIDKSSSGGSLLDSVGGLDGALSMASKFFK